MASPACYSCCFVVIFALVIANLVLTLISIKLHPKFRMLSAVVENLNYSNSSDPSFSMKFVAEMTVENPHRGDFDYGNTNVTFVYRGVQLLNVLVPGATVEGFGSRNLSATVDLNSNNARDDRNLGREIRSGFLTLISQSKMNGWVEGTSSVLRRVTAGPTWKSAAMNCTLEVNLTQKLVQDIKCS